MKDEQNEQTETLKSAYPNCNLSAASRYYAEDIALDPELQDIYRFRTAMALPLQARGNIPPIPRNARHYMTQQARRMFEECNEFLGAVTHDDLAGMADALVDLVYFAKGTAAILGLPWEMLWNEVQEANMRKAPGMSKRLDQTNDVKKPEDWVGPDIDGVLNKFKYLKEA